MHDFNNGRLPEAFINTWTFNRDIEGYRLRNADDIYLPRFNYNSLRFHPFFYLPEIWNKMKNDFKNSQYRPRFLLNLKEYLLHKLDTDFNINCFCDLGATHHHIMIQNFVFNINDYI